LVIQECELPDTHIHQHVLFQPELVERSSTAEHPSVREKISIA
jgi:LacI family transcriptional regulator